VPPDAVPVLEPPLPALAVPLRPAVDDEPAVPVIGTPPSVSSIVLEPAVPAAPAPLPAAGSEPEIPARPVTGIDVPLVPRPAVAVPVVLAGRPAVAVDPAFDAVVFVLLVPLVPAAAASTAPLLDEESSLEHAPVINKTHVSHSARCFMSRHPCMF
jgi:hypothetical protein